MTWREWTGRVAFVGAAFAVVAVQPGGEYRFVLVKLMFVALAVALGALAVPRGRLTRGVCVAGGLAAVWAVVAALAGAAPVAQLVGRFPRYEGLVAGLVYLGAAWLGARLLGPGAPESEARFGAAVMAWLAVALGVFSLLDAVGLHVTGDYAGRTGSLLGNASDQGLAGVLLAGVLAGQVLWELGARRGAAAGWSVRRWALSGGGLAGALATVLCSRSRGAEAGAVVAVVVAGVLVAWAARGRRGGGRWALAAAGGVVVARVGVCFAVPALRRRVLGLGAAGKTAAARFDFWGSAWRIIRSHLLVGVGPSGFVDAYPAAMSAHAGLTRDPANTLDSPHNVILQLLLAGGLPLLLCALALVALIVWRALRGLGALTRADMAGVGVEGFGSFGAVNLPSASTLRGKVPLASTPGARTRGVVGVGSGAGGGAGRAAWIIAALAALAGYATGLMAHFTIAGTAGLAALLAGALAARPVGSVKAALPVPAGGTASAASRKTTPTKAKFKAAGVAARPYAPGAAPGRARRRFDAAVGLVALAGTVALAVASVGEWDLARAFRATAGGTVAQADQAFASAQRTREWDADVAVIAAVVMSERAVDGNDATAGRDAVTWANKALGRVPDSVEAARAKGVGLIAEGQDQAALAVLDPLLARVPRDAQAHLWRGIARGDLGQTAAARQDLAYAKRNPATKARAKAILKTLAAQAASAG